MPRCSDIINYPEPMSSVPSRHTGVTEISALIAVIALLHEVVDLIESLQLGSHHLSFFKRKDRAQAAAQKKLCDGIVNAANSLTELFNQSPFKDHLYPYLKPALDVAAAELSLYRNRIVRELKGPLEVEARKLPEDIASLEAFEITAKIILSGLYLVVKAWLKEYL